MKITHILSIITSIILFSCKKNETKKDSINIYNKIDTTSKKIDNKITMESDLNLDIFLKCSSTNFVYVENYFRLPDYGCVYNPKFNKENNIGWADVFLILNKEKKMDFQNYTEDDIYNEEDKITELSIEELKSNYIPLIFLIDKKFLKKNTEKEITYYPSFPYTYKEYIFNNKTMKWSLLDSLKVDKIGMENKWIMSEVNKVINSEQN